MTPLLTTLCDLWTWREGNILNITVSYKYCFQQKLTKLRCVTSDNWSIILTPLYRSTNYMMLLVAYYYVGYRTCICVQCDRQDGGKSVVLCLWQPFRNRKRSNRTLLRSSWSPSRQLRMSDCRTWYTRMLPVQHSASCGSTSHSKFTPHSYTAKGKVL